MNGHGANFALFELVSQTVGAVLGLAKDDGAAVFVDEFHHGVHAVVLVDVPEVVVYFARLRVTDDVVNCGVVREL